MQHPRTSSPTLNEDLNRTKTAMHRIYTRWAEQGAAVLEAEVKEEANPNALVGGGLASRENEENTNNGKPSPTV